MTLLQKTNVLFPLETTTYIANWNPDFFRVYLLKRFKILVFFNENKSHVKKGSSEIVQMSLNFTIKTYIKDRKDWIKLQWKKILPHSFSSELKILNTTSDQLSSCIETFCKFNFTWWYEVNSYS